MDPAAILGVVLTFWSVGNPMMLVIVGLFSLALFDSYAVTRSAVRWITLTQAGQLDPLMRPGLADRSVRPMPIFTPHACEPSSQAAGWACWSGDG